MTAHLADAPHLGELHTAIVDGHLTTEQRRHVAAALMAIGSMIDAEIEQGVHTTDMEAARWRIVRDQCISHITAAVGATPTLTGDHHAHPSRPGSDRFSPVE